MKALSWLMFLVGCVLSVAAFAQDCPTVDIPLCCTCFEGHRNAACAGGGNSGSCKCTPKSTGGCTSSGACALHVCICCALDSLNPTSSMVSTSDVSNLLSTAGKGAYAGCMQMQKVLQSANTATVKEMQLGQKWLKSPDLIANLASYSPIVSRFVQWDRDSTLKGEANWSMTYRGKWNSDPANTNEADTSVPWGTFEAAWNDKMFVYSKLQFHNVQTNEPDQLVIKADGTWTMLKGEAVFAMGTWAAK